MIKFVVHGKVVIADGYPQLRADCGFAEAARSRCCGDTGNGTNLTMKPRAVVVAITVALVAPGLVFLLRPRTPTQRLANLQKEESKTGGIVFQTTLSGQEIAFLLSGCKLYRLDASSEKVARELVLEGDFYLGFTTCMKQSIREQDGYVRVFLLKPALGAGGGNAGGGTYRSRDGRHWETFIAGSWQPKS